LAKNNEMKGLFWGLLTIDLHFFTDHYPAENSKIKARKFNSYIGGPATNAAITFQHLGGRARLVTSVGKNIYKSMIYEELSEYNVSIYDLKVNEKTEPVFASIVTNERNSSRTIFSYHPKDTDHTPDNTIENDTQIAMFDGFYIKSAIEAARNCRDQGIVTVLDGGSWKAGMENLLQYMDIAICSADFFPPGITEIDDVTEYMLKKGVHKTAITRGEKAIITNEGEVNFLVDVPKIDAVDSLGAGDIFHGAFCYFYTQTKNFLVALEKAAQIAAYSCQFSGPRGWMERA
jgi:sugar/nucleoside kinase (ribokinase family)